jgi:hypothetical protein
LDFCVRGTRFGGIEFVLRARRFFTRLGPRRISDTFGWAFIGRWGCYAPWRVTPSQLSDMVELFVVTVALHGDVAPRLSPLSFHGLLKHLLHIWDTWVKVHLLIDGDKFFDSNEGNLVENEDKE